MYKLELKVCTIDRYVLSELRLCCIGLVVVDKREASRFYSCASSNVLTCSQSLLRESEKKNTQYQFMRTFQGAGIHHMCMLDGCAMSYEFCL